MPEGTTVDDLKELFKPYGDIAEIDVVNRCGFLHMEDKTLAFKAIDELNNTTFKGTRISVEKGRNKSRNPGRGGGRGFGRGPGRNGPGPMRGGRDNFRSGPYSRDNFDRRGPPRGGFGGGFNRDFGGRGPMNDRSGPMGNRSGPMNGRSGPMNNRPMNDGYGMGDRRGDRRPLMNEDRNDNGFGGSGFGNQGGNFGGNMGKLKISRFNYLALFF